MYKLFILLSLLILSSCLSGRKDRYEPPVEKVDIEIETIEEKEPISFRQTGELGLAKLTIDIPSDQKDFIITLTPDFELKPLWIFEKRAPFTTSKIQGLNFNRYILCHFKIFTISEYTQVPFYTANVRQEHFEIMIGNQKIAYGDNAEWQENSDDIKITIQNFRESNQITIINKSSKEIKTKKINTEECEEANINLNGSINQPNPHRNIPIDDRAQYYHFRYNIE